MKYKILLFLTFLILEILGSVFSPSFCAPINTNPIISVGISDNSFQRYYYSENTFYATKKLLIQAGAEKQYVGEFEPNLPMKVAIKDNLFEVYNGETLVAQELSSPLTLSVEPGGLLGVFNLKRAGKPALYRGRIELVKPSNKENMFLINNVLNLETYLKGVVPNEMPVRFGLEALKAQAVAARNYALRPREKKYHEFDICDSVACQVYFGANTEAPLASRAVDETRGIVAWHKDNLILALYSSTAGGYTEDYDNAFLPKNKGEHPYLKAVPDNEKIEPLNEEKSAESFYTSDIKTYDNESPYFRWTREWTKDEMENSLKANLKAAFGSGYCHPELKNPEDFGILKEIKVLKRGNSGKIVSMQIITDKEKFTVEKELTIRRLFKNNGKALPSANAVFVQEFDENKNLVKITAYGGGYGHGVGMSQFGAGAMAKEGKTFDEILQHYYSDTALVLKPVELTPEADKNSAVYDFFLTKKQAKIVLENKFAYSEMKVVINGKEFNMKSQPSTDKKYHVDISQYLNLGSNKVYFFYPLDNNKGKKIKVYIELYGTEEESGNDGKRR